MAYEEWLPYFPELSDLVGRKKDLLVLCPFHADSKPSFHIDPDKNIAHCFGCQWGGTLKDFIKDVKGFDLDSLLEERKTKKKEEEQKKKIVAPFLSLERGKEAHESLLLSERWLKMLKEKRLLEIATIKQFQLGLENDRIIVPILDFKDRIVNFRKYNPTASDKYISETGHGQTRIFPIENLNKDNLLFLEGEMDTLLGNQLGYNAITLTTGAGAKLPNEYLSSLRGKEISICYDLDEAGKKGAIKLRNSLLLFAKEIKILNLPEDLGDHSDFTDFFSKGHKKEEFDILLTEKIEEVELENLILSKYWNKRISITAKVSGKMMTPYLVPKKIRFSCKRNEGTLCSTCFLGQGDFDLEFYPSNPIYLELIENSKREVDKILRSQITVPKKCFVTMDKLEYQNVESIRLLPSDLFSTSGEYITRQVYFVGAGIKTNAVYKLQGLVIPEPKLQHSTFLIEKAEQEAGVLSQFTKRKDLKVFQSDDVSGKLMEIYRDFESNVTYIFGRSEILQVLDLVYFSPITFRFAGRLVPKGWSEALIIGDSREGKSETARKLAEHYQLGVYTGGEDPSLAGLKGGVAQVGRTWQLQWGLIPLNHRGLVVIDDIQSMKKEVLSGLSRIRSEGVAEIIKIESQQTLAQTRLIWISNPIQERTMATYSYGIESVPDLVERPSDIARFDIVVCIQKGEVDMTQIPAYVAENREHIYTSELSKELLLWNWTRQPEQIVFESEAEKLVFQVSNEFLEKYNSPIPIVKSGEEHIVIAKLAVAIAGRLYSTDETEEKIIVFPRHVQFVREFLFDIWDSQSCLYNEYASLKKKENQIEDTEEVMEMLSESRRKKLVNDLLRYREFQLSDFEDLLAADRSTAKMFISMLVRNRALSRRRSVYTKTPAFIKLLKGIQREKGEEAPF